MTWISLLVGDTRLETNDLFRVKAVESRVPFSLLGLRVCRGLHDSVAGVILIFSGVS